MHLFTTDAFQFITFTYFLCNNQSFIAFCEQYKNAISTRKFHYECVNCLVSLFCGFFFEPIE